MAFFDKLSDFAKNISDKTSDAIETGKLQNRSNSEKNLAGEDLKKIGEFYYGVWLETGQVAPEVLELCQSAKAHYDAAAEALAEIERIRAENEAAKAAAAAPPAPTAPVPPAASDALPCPGCGASNAPGTKFCCNCGTKLEISAPPVPKTCPGCGAVVAEGMRFCGECGTRTE